MKGGNPANIRSALGFTIVETMIFLAVSGLILVSAIKLLSGKQDSTEFSTGLGTLTSQLQTDLNNVSTGFYSLPDTTGCKVSGATITIVTSVGFGQSFGCTFIGDALAFGYSNAQGETYKIFPVIGMQYANNTPPIESTSLADAHPTTFSTLASTVSMPYGLTVASINYGSPATSIGAIGFFTTFNTYAAGITSQLNSGSQNIEIAPLPSSTLNDTNAVAEINSLTDNCPITGDICEGTTPGDPAAPINPPSGIQLCVNSSSTTNSAKLTLGGVNSASFIATQIYTKQGCT